jgi:hypothetical protein
LVLCLAIAITPHVAFLTLWSMLPLDSRVHSLIGQLLLGYERIVLGLHELLKPYEALSWVWWGAVVLTVGWIAVGLSRPWLLDRFLYANRGLSKVAFTVGLVVYFTATTSIATKNWDPNAPQHLQIVLRKEWEAIALRQIADDFKNEIIASPGRLDGGAIPIQIIDKWPSDDPMLAAIQDEIKRFDETGRVPSGLNETPQEYRSRLEAKRRAYYEVSPPLSADDRKAVMEDFARKFARQRVEAALADARIYGPDAISRQHDAGLPPRTVGTFQSARDRTDDLLQRAEVARTAAAEAVVSAAAGIDLTHMPIVKDLVKEMLGAVAEEVSSRTIEKVPLDLILTNVSDLSTRINKIIDPGFWKQVAWNAIVGTGERSQPPEEIARQITVGLREAADQRRAIMKEAEVRDRSLEDEVIEIK